MSCPSAITLGGELRSTPSSDPVTERQEGGVPHFHARNTSGGEVNTYRHGCAIHTCQRVSRWNGGWRGGKGRTAKRPSWRDGSTAATVDDAVAI